MYLGRGRLGSIGQDRATWLVLLSLLLGVLAPAACVVWFMNEAIANQADATRQRVSEAYRGQLRLLRDRIDADWRTRTAQLDANTGSGPAAFRRAVLTRSADAVVFFGGDGMPAYPSLSLPARASDPLADHSDWRTAQMLERSRRYAEAASIYAWMAAHERNRSIAARAAQAHVRMLMQRRDTAEALRAIEKYFTSGPMTSSRDPLGRSIAADAQLLALRLIPASDARHAEAVQRLAVLLNDYERPLPSAQRLFLMSELSDIAPSTALPTLPAERLATQFLEADGKRPNGLALEASSLPGLWKLRVHDDAVALFTTETVAAMARPILEEPRAGSDATFAIVPPGTIAGGEAIAASPLLPGWQIAFSLSDAQALQKGSREQMTTYLWSGTVAISFLTVAGLLLWQSFQRQLRLTRLRTDLVAAVSHELKTPLASMRLLVDSLLDDEELDRRKTRDYLQLIAGENARLTRLIEHFLTFSRIERNRHRLVFAEVQPAAVVRSAVNLVRERFEASRADFQVDVVPDLPPLYGDEDALVTVLLNLLENAHNYTRADKRIALHAYREADRVVFEVKDNGIGIAPRDQKRVFKRFYQVDRRLARETGGCGLGLSIVDFIVRAHGGAVALRSQMGVGSSFSVSIPCRGAAQEATA
ncbi:MAG TPA: HAMP domain-containing sensor histidine kinase [Vicinamibacterales bacterium]|nr:HAMP domain-containing sensor histidine kinase [Vicinamibacterales bacterium]